MRDTVIEYWRIFLNYLGLAFIAFGIVVLMIFSYVGIYPPELLTAYGTLLLVIVTFGYVLQNGQMLQEMQEERDLNEQTLREMQKGPRIMVISHGIDEVFAELEDDRGEWEELEPVIERMPVEERVPFPELYRIDLPDDGTLDDIGANYSGFMETIERYRGVRSEYRDKWFSLRDDIQEFIEEEWALGIARDPPEELTEMAERSPQDDVAEMINQHNRDLSDFILKLGPEERSRSGTTEGIWKVIDRHLIQIRDHERFEEGIEELDRLLDLLKSLNEELIYGLESARKAFKEEYDIKEPEISESREIILSRERAREREFRRWLGR